MRYKYVPHSIKNNSVIMNVKYIHYRQNSTPNSTMNITVHK